MVNLNNITNIKEDTRFAIREYGIYVETLSDIKRGIAIANPDTTKILCEYDTIDGAKEALSYFSPSVLVDSRIHASRPICFAEFAIVNKNGDFVEQSDDTMFFDYLNKQISDFNYSQTNRNYLEKTLDRYLVMEFDVNAASLSDIKKSKKIENVTSNTVVASFDNLEDAHAYLNDVHPFVNIDIDSNPKLPVTYTEYAIIDSELDGKILCEKGPDYCFRYVNKGTAAEEDMRAAL